MGGPGSGEDPRAAIARLEQAREVSPPETAAVTHGLYMTGGALMVCNRCPVRGECAAVRAGERCALEGAYIPARRQEIAAALTTSGHDPALYDSLVTSVVFGEVRLARAMRYLAAAGELLPGADEAGFLEYQPVAKEVVRLQAEVRAGLDALDLTPKARRQLGDGGGGPDLGALVRAAAEAEAKRRAEAVDADFEAADQEAQD